MLKTSKTAVIAAALGLAILPGTSLTSGAAAAQLTQVALTTSPPSSSASSEGSSSAEPSTDTTSTSSDFTSSLSIPTITAVDSSMDEAALRDALGGNFAKHVDDIAKLTASSISIPEITLKMTVTADGASTESTMTYRDIVLSNVKNGVAESASVGSAETTSPTGSFKFGKMSTSGLDFGGILALYSFVPNTGADAPMKPLYKDFTFDGGTLTTDKASCTFGKVSVSEFDARPLKVSFAQMMEAAQKLDAAKSASAPPAEAVATFVTFLTDVFQSFKSTPVNLDGLSCSGTGDEGKPFEFKIGSIGMEGYQPGIYPAITLKDLKVTSGPQDNVAVASATFKATDLTPPIDAIQSNAANLSEAWFKTNYRKLIPSFGGFSLSGVVIDVPDSDRPGERIKANIADFDLTLSDYVNGIPTKVSTKASGIDVPLPADSTDETVKMLTALGISRVNLGFELAANWDPTAQAINLDTVSFSGVDLGSFSLATKIGNATEKLFDIDPDVQQSAALATTVKSITLSATDAGLGDKLVPLLAAEQGVSDSSTFRTQMAGVAEGAALQLLGSTDAARSLGAAVGDFIAGKAKALTITVTAKDANGISFPVLMQASNDPAALSSAVDITGSNAAP